MISLYSNKIWCNWNNIVPCNNYYYYLASLNISAFYKHTTRTRNVVRCHHLSDVLALLKCKAQCYGNKIGYKKKTVHSLNDFCLIHVIYCPFPFSGRFPNTMVNWFWSLQPDRCSSCKEASCTSMHGYGFWIYSEGQEEAQKQNWAKRMIDEYNYKTNCQLQSLIFFVNLSCIFCISLF